MAEEIHVGDVGTEFRDTIKDGCGDAAAVVDVSSVSTKTYRFKKPDGTTIDRTASFYTDGTDGIVYYTTVAGDLDMAGTWKKQIILDFGTNEFRTDIQSFRVYPNL